MLCHKVKDMNQTVERFHRYNSLTLHAASMRPVIVFSHPTIDLAVSDKLRPSFAGATRSHRLQGPGHLLHLAKVRRLRDPHEVSREPEDQQFMRGEV